MTVKFRVAGVPKKDGARPNWTNPKDVMDARDAVVKRQASHHGKGYVMREVGAKKWGPERTLAEVKSELPARFSHLQIGETWSVRALVDDHTVWTRKVEVEPSIIQTPGTAAIDKIWTWLHEKFPGQWENWGICVCKRIEGSSSWSQHAYCNALDIHSTVTTMGKIASAATAAAKAGTIPCDQVIWQGWEHVHGGSVYDHYDHVHFTGLPQMSGWPPCA